MLMLKNANLTLKNFRVFPKLGQPSFIINIKNQNR